MLNALEPGMVIFESKDGAWEPLGGRGNNEAIEEAEVSGDKVQSVIMLSDTEDLVTVMYCNEIFDPSHPDTCSDPVLNIMEVTVLFACI